MISKHNYRFGPLPQYNYVPPKRYRPTRFLGEMMCWLAVFAGAVAALLLVLRGVIQ